MKNVDILIIGAGISGATLAERYASAGKKVLVIEKETISPVTVTMNMTKTESWCQNTALIFFIPMTKKYGNT